MFTYVNTFFRFVEFASSAYMEMILTAAPTSKKDSSWAAKLRKAATG